jgi:hypothetical protein
MRVSDGLPVFLILIKIMNGECSYSIILLFIKCFFREPVFLNKDESVGPDVWVSTMQNIKNQREISIMYI